MSSILPCQITAAQTALGATFTDSVIISRKTAVQSDGTGGRKATSGTGWTTVVTVLGLLTTTRLTPRERDVASQIKAPVPYSVFLPVGTDLRSQDRLVIAGRTFEVQGVAVAESIALAMKAYCSELQT